jgi:Ala-tRNA(Pro) deacylase
MRPHDRFRRRSVDVPDASVRPSIDAGKPRPAATAGVANVVVLRDSAGGSILVALPPGSEVDLAAVARTSGRAPLRPATDEESAPLFADCEWGAAASFGHVYGVPVYVDACFGDEPSLFSPGGRHHERIGMRLSDYEGVEPVVGRWCLHHGQKAA